MEGKRQGRTRESSVLIAVLLATAAAAWIVIVVQAEGMGSMAGGMGQLGWGLPYALAPLAFMGMWLGMMVAMMFPTIVPMVLAHRMVVDARGEGWLPTAAFVAGYLAIWTAIGLVPLAALMVLDVSVNPAAAWVSPAAGVVLILAGVYQFTPLKGICLKACRSPLHFVMTHDFESGSRGAANAGVVHGVLCLGCCWTLMTVLVVVGLMNLVWMAALAVIILLEKNWRYGVALSRVAGGAVAAIGLAILVQPQLLMWLANGHM